MMDKPKIDFLKQKYELSKSPQEPFVFFGRAMITGLVILATFGVIFSYRVTTSMTDAKDESTKFTVFSTIKSFMNPNDGALEGEQDDRVNVLLLGIGGEGHEGPQLTDTILFTSFRPSTKNIAFLSLPRDMTVNIPGYGYQKVNHANAYGEKDKKGSGPILASSVLEELLQQPIPYYVRVDFGGFAELIDTMGGIDVFVDQAFTDTKFPILGREYDTCSILEQEKQSVVKLVAQNYDCRFTSLSFKQGWTHMNGKTALAFVRSRHGNNGEGSDFARSRRQQKILLAVKDKVFSLSTFFNPLRLKGILETLENNIVTNLSIPEIVRLGKDLRDLKSEEVASHVIDASPNSPLYETMVNGAYLLLPKNDDWTPIQKMARYIFTQEKTNTPAPIAKQTTIEIPAPKLEIARVEIQNGTQISGLAFRASQLLGEKQSFSIMKVGNAPTRNYTHTVIFDLTDGKKSADLKSLQTFFQTDLALTASGWMKNNEVVPKELSLSKEEVERMAKEERIDFLIILGESSRNVVLK